MELRNDDDLRVGFVSDDVGDVGVKEDQCLYSTTEQTVEKCSRVEETVAAIEETVDLQKKGELFCSICLDFIDRKQDEDEEDEETTVVNPFKGRIYGILDNCSHPFCWKCICPWRFNKGGRRSTTCPVCRTHSDFCHPSPRWISQLVEKRRFFLNNFVANCDKAIDSLILQASDDISLQRLLRLKSVARTVLIGMRDNLADLGGSTLRKEAQLRLTKAMQNLPKDSGKPSKPTDSTEEQLPLLCST